MKQWKIGRLSAGIGLILLGVLLIIARIQSLYYFEMLEKWWPVLIICLGIELVVGAFLAGNSNITVTVDGKSVFIAVLIVIFVFVGSGISFAARNKGAFLNWDGLSFNSYSNEKTVSNKMEFQGKKSITIENKQGKVSIDKSDSDKIQVEANIVIAYNDESTISDLQKQAIQFADGEDLVVSTSNQSGKDGAVRKVDYTIKLPASVRYDVESAYGDVSISNISSDGKSSQSNGSTNITNVKGNTEITNKYGSVKIDTLEGNLQLSCNNGDINLFNIKGKITASNAYGATNAENIIDDIDFKGSNGAFTGKNIGGFAKVTSKYGDVTLINPSKGLNVEANNGTIKVDCNKPIEGDVTIYSNYGSINTKIVKDQSAKFNCSSRNGSITNGLGLSGDNKNRNSTLGGEINGGKYLFMMETKNGSISIN
ncbi:DUF4097 family beta strand repeat-containing protein [Clostridium manihotivorum]|uniref:DUF4097 domain-containing protein n=1 Tax=Clostridium manihotivorum TaxID=2320868 RepID=A0A3R5UHS7_9CLOT|nr:DUF4097 family beta strand repeat-containing protein [Clostridium manihotivorum]QAA34051.1 hypothetical protein C1I91_21840 [Clostridium manihotivorum]